jgi:hypothetical protein
MSIASDVRAFIEKVPINQVFYTRHLLHLGSRSAIDQETYRLVCAAKICRLADGIFVKRSSDMPKLSMFALAKHKAAAFSKEIVEHGKDIGKKLGISKKANKKTTFNVSGRASSSFRSHIHKRRIYLKATAARRFVGGKTKVGKIVRALWQLGKNNLNAKILKRATRNFSGKEIRVFHEAAFRVPGWLAEYTNRRVFLSQKLVI